MIVAFDLATTTGACDGAPTAPPRLWTWELRDGGDMRGERLNMLDGFIRSYFDETLDKKRIDLVVYEAPMPIAAMTRAAKYADARYVSSEATITFLRATIGVLEMHCARRKIIVEPVNVQDARQSVLGWRTSKGDTKQRVAIEIDRYYDVQAANEHEADAFVLWKHAHYRLNPRLAIIGTPLFRGSI